MAEEFLRIEQLRKLYPGAETPAVDDIDLGVAEGELLALLGPSGCGKTTTLRMIAGLVEPSAGSIKVAGRDVTRVPVHRREMGMVFQSFALFPHLDVTGNVAFGLEMRGVSAADRRRRVAEVLERVELAELAGRRVGQLSGGQQQRVALARALVVDPTVLLLDEPLSALDAKLRESLRVQIRDLQQASGTTSVFVTHDQDEALSMSDRVAVMQDGRVAQVGTPAEIYQNPDSIFVATFIGRANLLSGRRDGDVVDVPGLGKIRAVEPYPAAQDVTAMIRPQAVTLAHLEPDGAPRPEPVTTRPEPVEGQGAASASFDGVIRSTSYTGDQISYAVEVAEHTLTVETAAAAGLLQQGERVRLSWSAADVRLLER